MGQCFIAIIYLMEQRNRTPGPEYIRVYEQAGGVNFRIIRAIPWRERPTVNEYLATTVVRVADVEEQLVKCKRAWEQESGIYFEYPDYSTGMRRAVRIVEAKNLTPKQKDGNPHSYLGLAVILKQEDYDDMKSKESPTGM